MTLTEFLQARITEQEIRCRTLLETEELSPAVRRALGVALRDCEAKRQIIEVMPDADDMSWDLLVLAAVFSDHPDWRAEWTP